MIYLVLAICCSASIALLFQYTESSGCNRYLVTTFNYATACVVSLALLLKGRTGLFPQLEHPWQALAGNLNGQLTAEGSFMCAVLLGMVTGIFYLVGFIMYPIAIRENGPSLAGMFNKLGILIPMIVSIFIWNELLGTAKWAGVLLSLIAIILVNLGPAGGKLELKLSLLLVFIFSGTGEFLNKVFQKYALLEYKNHFLFCVFFTAFLISLVVLFLHRKEGLRLKGCLLGICIGVPNLFSSFFLIEALNHLQAAVVFPLYSAGTIVLIMLVSFVAFHERLKPREKIAAALTVVSMVFINL